MPRWVVAEKPAHDHRRAPASTLRTLRVGRVWKARAIDSAQRIRRTSASGRMLYSAAVPSTLLWGPLPVPRTGNDWGADVHKLEDDRDWNDRHE